MLIKIQIVTVLFEHILPNKERYILIKLKQFLCFLILYYFNIET